MKIAIAGGHGTIALHLTRLLAEAGHEVASIVRNPDHCGDVEEAGGTMVVADLESATPDELAETIGAADVAVFAGDRRGIIYVQGERVANVKEEEILDRLLEECCKFQQQVRNGEASLGEKRVDIVPPDPIGELGSGVDKINAGNVEQITIDKS